MKTLIKLFLVFSILVFVQNGGYAQNARKERQAAKTASIKKLLDEKDYIFKANLVTPETGGQHQLTSEYDLTVTKDTVKAWLPYFGRAYIAPTDPTDGGIKFNYTNFDYSTKQNKNGSWDVLIKPRDKNISDMRDVQSLRLTISTSGYASLQVISSNRDPISFDGIIEQRDKH